MECEARKLAKRYTTEQRRSSFRNVPESQPSCMQIWDLSHLGSYILPVFRAGQRAIMFRVLCADTIALSVPFPFLSSIHPTRREHKQVALPRVGTARFISRNKVLETLGERSVHAQPEELAKGDSRTYSILHLRLDNFSSDATQLPPRI